MIAYKFLRRDGTSVFTHFSWPLPSDGPGAWVDAPPDPCRSGVHACRLADLPFWVGRVLYEVELEGEVTETPTKVVASRARLLRRVWEWDDALRDAYTRMCADRAHDLARGATPALADWDAVIEPSVPEGPALLGFVAARIGEEVAGPSGYRAERARQTAWLVNRLSL
ncbi:MAG: hypothetical protein ACRDWY_15175 [Actinomycetes bacterium]